MGKVYCQICNKRCKGDVLKVHDKFIHKTCFLCCCCKTSLERGGFFLKEDKYYCKHDYLEKFGVKCKVCNEIAEGEVIVIFATTFHPNCFKCKNCVTIFQRGDKVTLCNGEYLCYGCVFKQSCSVNEIKPISPNKSDQTLTIKKESTDDLDAMTASLISTIVSDSSETESVTPEKRNAINRFLYNNSKKEPKETSSYSRSTAKDDYLSSDSECISIRTEPETSRYIKSENGVLQKDFNYRGSISSLKPSQSPLPFGKFYNVSYLSLEEKMKNQIHPRALYKTARSISTSSSNIHHYHKIDNFSYRSSSNVAINKRNVRANMLMQVINGKKNAAVEAQLKDETKMESNIKPLIITKPIIINGSNSPKLKEASAASMVNISTSDSATIISDYQSGNKKSYPTNVVRPITTLDPISASRAPNASYEPLTKPRYIKHMFTSPSRHLTSQEATEFLPTLSNAEILARDSSDSVATHQPIHPISEYNRSKPLVTRSQVICSRSNDQDHISVQSFLRSFSREKLTEDRRPKIYPYEILKISNLGIPKGVDRSKLEIYLSEEDFKNIFKLSLTAFNRLPEWKRNDLKKRVDLF